MWKIQYLEGRGLVNMHLYYGSYRHTEFPADCRQLKSVVLPQHNIHPLQIYLPHWGYYLTMTEIIKIYLK